MMTKFGFLRETGADAKKAGIDKATGFVRTGLDEYLKAIFPAVDDWIHDKPINLGGRRYRPDYRSETLKLVVEFDGMPHYLKPTVILSDEEKNSFYQENGYKVVRIPFFIQLTNAVVKDLFGVDVKEPLFPEGVASFSVADSCTPAFMCPLGIGRCALELLRYPEQMDTNLAALIAINNEDLSGYSYLKHTIDSIKMQ